MKGNSAQRVHVLANMSGLFHKKFEIDPKTAVIHLNGYFTCDIL